MYGAFALLGSLERDLVHALNCKLDGPFWDAVLPVVMKKEIAVPVYLALLVAASLWRRRRTLRAFLSAAAAYGVCMGIATILWAAVERPRPWRVYAPILRTEAEIATCDAQPQALVGRGHLSRRNSFPSRHALTAGVFAASLWGISRGLGVVAALFALLVAIGRVWKGVHWPSDVAAGLLLGVLATWFTWRMVPAALGWRGKRHWVEDPSVPEEDSGQSASGTDGSLG